MKVSSPYLILELNSLQSLLDQLWRLTPSTMKMVFTFDKLFVALQPCIDGFKNGCRPYLGIDSTVLTVRYNGQLVAACALDGHNWMYPVAWGIIGSESKENWTWFMTS